MTRGAERRNKLQQHRAFQVFWASHFLEIPQKILVQVQNHLKPLSSRHWMACHKISHKLSTTPWHLKFIQDKVKVDLHRGQSVIKDQESVGYCRNSDLLLTLLHHIPYLTGGMGRIVSYKYLQVFEMGKIRKYWIMLLLNFKFISLLSRGIVHILPDLTVF